MDCVLVAGGRPAPDDPLYPHSKGGPKALLAINGRPLIDYVLRAMLLAQSVDRIVVVGLPAHVLDSYGPRVEFIDDQGGMVANGLAGLSRVKERNAATRYVLFASADIPAATGVMIDDVVERCRPLDYGAYYFMVERRVMEEEYPGSNRTYVKLKDLEVAGADIVIADARLAAGNTQLLTDLSAGRKQAWKLARLAGLSTIFALITGRLTLRGIERRAARVLGTPVSVSLLPYPQLAMDVDRPEQLLLMRRLLS